MGQKFFLHKNKKACYNNIDTCSCGLSFPRELAGLARRVLVYVRETMRKVSRNRFRRRLSIDFTSQTFRLEKRCNYLGITFLLSDPYVLSNISPQIRPL
ncbi:MAG: hypothetical protein LBG13_00250 [Holosporales bacterium]|nr:hypothetical protein [Holosporales bacterium]